MKNAVLWDKKPSSYLTGDTLHLRYRAQPGRDRDERRVVVNTMSQERMPSSGMLCRLAVIRIDFSEERSASIIRVTIGELRKMLAVTSNRRTQRRNT
jgi:hypothetical protein